MKQYRNIICKYCGEEFKTQHYQSKYCSTDCRKKWWNESRPRKSVKKICVVCGEEFISPKGRHLTCSKECSKIHCSQYRTTEYKNQHTDWDNCIKKRKEYYKDNAEEIKAKSLAYYNENRDRIRNEEVDAECSVCGETFQMKKQSAAFPSNHYCSSNCRKVYFKKYYSGENSHMWEGGKTALYDKVRNSEEVLNWKIAVWGRDNNTCQCCHGKSSWKVRVHAHHIINFAKLYEGNESLLLDVDNGITLCEDCHTIFHGRYGRKNNNLEQVKNFIGYV